MKSGGYLPIFAAVITRLRPCQGLRRLAASALLVFAFALAMPVAAEAAAGRTWVAHNGSDSNTSTNCAESAPCQTFAAAYSVTVVGGEIVAIDGGGYGPLTITNSVRILALQMAFIKPAAGATGITINAGSSGKVTLQNIEINGAGGASTTGIALNSGNLILRNVILTQLTTGLLVNSSVVDVIDSEISFNTTAISTTGSGVPPANVLAGGATEVRISGGGVLSNGTAFFMNDPGTVSGGGTQNLVTILLRLDDTASAAITTNITGNNAVILGAGATCDNAAGNCHAVTTYTMGTQLNLK